jgi:hypothetical protein
MKALAGSTVPAFAGAARRSEGTGCGFRVARLSLI